MDAKKSSSIKIVFILLSLLLGQRLTFGQEVSGAGRAQEMEEETRAEYWSFIPVVTRYLGYRESTGVLDPSFGGDGIVSTDIYFLDHATNLILQPDGKIVAAGFSSYDNFVLARYNPDGSLDSSLDNDGKMHSDLIDQRQGYTVAQQADGKYLVGGFYNQGSVGADDFALVRFNTDGSLDTAFGTDGLVLTDFGIFDEILALAIQQDGKIMAAGRMNASLNEDFAIARYNMDGSLDTSFNDDGKVTLDFFGAHDYAFAVEIQTDSKIVVGGMAYDCPHPCLALARYNTDGILDTSFGIDGKATVDRELSSDQMETMILQSDGKIVMAGYSLIGAGDDQDFFLVRFNPDGSLDINFGSQGWVTTEWGCEDSIAAIAIQPDGKIVAAGRTFCESPYDYFDIVLARYNPDGSLDPTFGSDGKVITDIGESEEAYALSIQADGKIIIAGRAVFYQDDYDFVLARYK
jgi:uncharacterized delta-60 repeat protein